MMKNLLISVAAAVTMAGAALTTSTGAQAQVGFEIGPAGPRVSVDRPYNTVVERRSNRRVVVEEDGDDEVCRVEVRRRVTASGDVVTRRTRVCE